VLNKITPGFCVDLHGLGEAFGDMTQMGFSGASPLGEGKGKTQLRLPQERATGRGTASGGRAGLPQAHSGDR